MELLTATSVRYFYNMNNSNISSKVCAQTKSTIQDKKEFQYAAFSQRSSNINVNNCERRNFILKAFSWNNASFSFNHFPSGGDVTWPQRYSSVDGASPKPQTSPHSIQHLHQANYAKLLFLFLFFSSCPPFLFFSPSEAIFIMFWV